MLYKLSGTLQVIKYKVCECCGAESDIDLYIPFEHETEVDKKGELREKFEEAARDFLDIKSKHDQAAFSLQKVLRFKSQLITQEILMRRAGYPEMFPQLVGGSDET